MTDHRSPMLGPQRTGRRIAARPRQRLHVVANNTDVPLAGRRTDRWGSPAARFALLVLASVALWTLIAFGLWRLVLALS